MIANRYYYRGMKHPSARVIGVVLVTAFALSACGKTGAADTAAIRHVLDEIVRTFNAGDYEAMFELYADDVIVSSPGQPEIATKAGWRAGLAQLPQGVSMQMRFDTKEIEVSGDLGYERGSFTMDIFDKPGGTKLTSVTNRHMHVFKRGADGRWLGWRLMENSGDPLPPLNIPAPPPK